MGENMSKEERIWAYLHAQMDPSERRAFEDRMGEDPALQAELKELRILHKDLGELTPYLDESEEALEQRILRDYEGNASEQGPGSVTRLTGWLADLREGTRTLVPMRTGLGLAVAAVLCVILLGTWHLMSGPLDWGRPQIILATYRGAEEPTPLKGYDQGVFRELHKLLQVAVGEAYTTLDQEAEQELTGKWRLQATFRELPMGGFDVTLQATHAGNIDDKRLWEERFVDQESFRDYALEWGQQIAKELVGTPQPGRFTR